MKYLKYLLTLVAVTGALTVSAKADLQFLGAEAFPGDNSPANNLTELQKFTSTDVGEFVLCLNVEDAGGVDHTISVMDGEFLVLHYGKGSGGTAKGGSLEFFQVINGETSVTVSGSPNAQDPFATGGLSSIRGFCPPGSHVPDSGTTAMLLGSALAGLGLVRRYVKR